MALDFSPVIENPILEQFDNNAELKKAYILRTNDWFLAEELSDLTYEMIDSVLDGIGYEDY